MQVRIIESLPFMMRQVPTGLGIKVVDEEIQIPSDVAYVLSKTGGETILQTPELFVTGLIVYESSLIRHFNSSKNEVVRARHELFKQLQGKVADRFLFPATPPRQVLGALPPGWLHPS